MPPEPRTDAHHQHGRAPILSTGETVTVGCKLPNGLNLGHLHGEDKPIVILNGANHPNAIMSVGMTHGVDKAAFLNWMEEHGGTHGIPAVAKGHVFHYDKAGAAIGKAKEMAAEKTGMEGLDPDVPANNIEPDDGQKKRNAEAAGKNAEREELAAKGL